MALTKPNTQITVPYSNRNAYYFVPSNTKHYIKAVSILNIFTNRPFKNIFKNLRVSLVNSSLLTRLITRGRWVHATNINISTIKDIKNLVRLMKSTQVQISKINKSIIKNIKSVYTQKVRDRERTFFRLIDIALIRTTRTSKALSKNVRSNFINSNKLNKTKATNIKANEIQSNRVNKQKGWFPKAENIQGINLIKAKYAILKVVEILTNRLSKQKNTIIRANIISSIKFNKKASKTPKAAQVVSATITRAATRRRGITSGITYTIASTRIQTILRQVKAVAINTFRFNKGTKKNISVSTINTLFVTRNNIAWKFLLKVVTKIVSFKAQTIEIPGYALPDPDPRDPNMLDSSTPSVEGTIYGNPDDDSFIE